MHLRAVLVITGLVLAIFAGPVALDQIWSHKVSREFVMGVKMVLMPDACAQSQPAPVSTSNFCYDPTYPRLVLQSGTGPRIVVIPEGLPLAYSMPIAVLPAESTWKVSTTVPWLSVPSGVTTGAGSIPVTIAGTQALGKHEGALNITITGLFKDAQGNNVSTVVPMPVSLEVIPRPPSGPPLPPTGKVVQVDAASGSSVLVIMRRLSLNDLQLTVNPGQQVSIKGVECTTTPGLARRCPVP